MGCSLLPRCERIPVAGQRYSRRTETSVLACSLTTQSRPPTARCLDANTAGGRLRPSDRRLDVSSWSPHFKKHLPHARGDHPHMDQVHIFSGTSAPRAWGSPLGEGRGFPRDVICPTHVGITPSSRSGHRYGTHLPHARGDHPAWKVRFYVTAPSAPRAWGSPLRRVLIDGVEPAGPTQAGIPHRRALAGHHQSRRPIQVGIIPRSTPPRSRGSSHAPRMWGSSHRRVHPGPDQAVRPTRVGITLSYSESAALPINPPHPRGDRPYHAWEVWAGQTSAPYTWGSPVLDVGPERNHFVRPTYVGIIPATGGSSGPTRRPPHERGDRPGVPPGRVACM